MKNSKNCFKFLLLFLLPSLAISQTVSSIEFLSGVNSSFRMLQAKSDDLIVNEVLKTREENESPKLNWQFGMNCNFNVRQKVFLKTGLRFANTGYVEFDRGDLWWGSQSDGNGGLLPGSDTLQNAKITGSYWFADTPLVGRWEMLSSRWSPFFEIGLTPTVFLFKRGTTELDQTKEIYISNLGEHKVYRFHLVGSVSVGLNYAATNNLQIFMQPTFRYHLTKLVDAPIRENLYSYGVEFGVRRKIGKVAY